MVLGAFCLAIVTAIAMTIACFGIGYALLPRRSRKLFEQQKIAHQTHEYIITNEAMTTSGALGSVTMPYALVYRWLESDKMFLLMQSEAIFYVLPKDVAGSDAIDCLRDGLQAAHIPGLRI